MYYLLGLEANVTNLVLASKSAGAGDIRSPRELKAAYQTYLATRQPSVTLSRSGEIELVAFSRDVVELARLYAQPEASGADRLTDDDIEETFARSDREAVVGRIERIRAARAFIARTNPEVSELFELAVNRIFFLPVESMCGGTVPDAIGVIWANPSPTWDLQDVVELLLHELNHTLGFVDEAVKSHYTDRDRLLDSKSFAMSSIRRCPRRLDLAVSSLAVGAEILRARSEWLGHPKSPRAHPPTDILVHSCRQTIESIHAIPTHRELLSERGLEIVGRCAAIVERC